MEVTRQQLGNGDERRVPRRASCAPATCCAATSRAPSSSKHVEQRVLTTTLDKAVNWARGNALFPPTFGLACCAIEMMSIVAARVDIARFGFEAFRASPRQADLMILSGRVSIKMAPVVRRIYDQMLEPKWAIAMGACSSLDGRLQQLRDRPGRQVHAGRRPRPRLPAAARGAHARDPQAARDDPWTSPTRAGASATAGAGTEEVVRPTTSRGRASTSSGAGGRRRCLTPPASS